MMTTMTEQAAKDAELSAALKHKFEVGQTVWKVERRGYRATVYTKAVVSRSYWKGHWTYSSKERANIRRFAEYINLDNGWRDIRATKNYILTEEEYERIRPEVEARLKAEDEANAAHEALKRAYFALVLDKLIPTGARPEQIELLQQYLQLPHSWTRRCFRCGRDHAYNQGDHEAKTIGIIQQEVAALR